MVYCLLTGGQCSHDIIVKPNSFFIAEPYDKNREHREQAIIKAIEGLPYYIADEDIMNIALTCKVCREIQAHQFGIVELTGLNENVLIELGMMYGFGKPVVLLLKKGALGIFKKRPKIKVPSNIIGLEQVRYDNFSDLSIKLKKAIKKLLELSKMGMIQMIDVTIAIHQYLKIIENQIDSKNLEMKNFEAIISEFATIGSSRFPILNKGKKHGVKEGMLFNVFMTEIELENGQLIEERVGIIHVYHTQPSISQATPIQMLSYEEFWATASAGKTTPKNVVRPFIFNEYEGVSIEYLEEVKSEMLRISRFLK